ncbi:hypothetical protein AB0M94_06565 [Streptomyces xanthochromogenes]|uniref:hypothetical protein n=1 Tax=Streptomyces xanthochromogenes TaxID=67384 RepID=UPI00343557E9
MPVRHFLTDDQLDAILGGLADATALPVDLADQVAAAARETSGMGYAMAIAAAAQGDKAFLGALPSDRASRFRALRPRLRMMLAALGGGITYQCDHADEIRPLYLFCDPPSLVCTQPRCITEAGRNARKVGFRWDNQCDGCGRPAQTVFPSLATLGPLTISGHVCKPCADEMGKTAVRVSAS